MSSFGRGFKLFINDIQNQIKKYNIIPYKIELIQEFKRLNNLPDKTKLFQILKNTGSFAYNEIPRRSIAFIKQIQIETNHYCNRKPFSSQTKEMREEETTEIYSTSDLANLTTKSTNQIAKERKVPSTRLGRLATFGSLAAGLSVDYMRNKLWDEQSHISTQSASRLVDTLCRVRGAALKLGQMLSIQDENIVSPELLKILDRVRQQADFMPEWQLEKILLTELGHDWKNKNFKEFDKKPFASASIGQVHKAVLSDGRQVAVKIQYPGIAKSIDSDIDNLMSILTYSNLFPPGLYLKQMLASMRLELKQEVDYVNEAQNQRRFRSLLLEDKSFYVPSRSISLYNFK